MYVDLNSNGKQYTKTTPIGCNIIGSVSNDDGSNPSALVCNKLSTRYNRLNMGNLSDIDQDAVSIAIADAMSECASPVATLGASGKRLRSVTLDDNTVALLRGYGGGNLSLGIRRAAELIERG